MLSDAERMMILGGAGSAAQKLMLIATLESQRSGQQSQTAQTTAPAQTAAPKTTAPKTTTTPKTTTNTNTNTTPQTLQRSQTAVAPSSGLGGGRESTVLTGTTGSRDEDPSEIIARLFGVSTTLGNVGQNSS